MTAPAFVASGPLGGAEDAAFIEDDDGGRTPLPGPVWSGYLAHWTGRRVRVARLPQRDYDAGAPILLLSPDEPPQPPGVTLFYNEPLPGYLSSLFGHIAIEVDGAVFTFSGVRNENEALSLAQFLYRPALGEFAGHPHTGLSDLSDPDKPYYEKFGRRFMRRIHSLRIEGLDTATLAAALRAEMTRVHQTPPHPRDPHRRRDFDPLRRNCATIIRDALRDAGLSETRGILPRDLFVSVAHEASRPDRPSGLTVQARRLDQLKVPERVFSRPCPVLNPLNRLRLRRLRRIAGGVEILGGRHTI